MVPWAKECAANPDILNSVRVTHMVETENQLLNIVLKLLYVCHGVRMPMCTHTVNVIKTKNKRCSVLV